MPGSEPVQSVARAGELLSRVARSAQGLTVRELADAMDLKRPTVSNLAKTLAELRFLATRSSPARYQLGPALAELIDLHARRSLVGEAATAIEGLHARHPQAGFVFAEVADADMRVRLRIEPRRPGVLQRIDVEVSHPYTKATAMVMHAFADGPAAAAYRRRYPFNEFGEGAWSDPQALDAYLAHARRLGYAPPPPGERSYTAVAAPVYGRGGVLAGAVGAYWDPDLPADPEAAVTASVRDAAHALSLTEASPRP